MADKPQTDGEETKPEEQIEPSAPSQEVSEEKTEEANVTNEESETETEEKPEEPVQQPSRRESLRIQQLLEKLKSQPPAQSVPTLRGGLDYGQALDADPEVIKQLQADRDAVALAQFQAGSAQGLRHAESIQFRTMLEIDAPKIEAKYPQLDKESADFDPATSDAINRWYLATVGYSPETGLVQNSGVRYSDFVESLMELAGRVAGEKTVATARNVARQASSTGLRPSGGTAKGLNLNKPPEQMSDEELKAVIAQAGM